VIAVQSAKRTNDNSPAIYRWGKAVIGVQSVKRTAELKRICLSNRNFQSVVRFADYVRSSMLFPALKCWAISNRPLIADCKTYFGAEAKFKTEAIRHPKLFY